jgi:hypothetical protein
MLETMETMFGKNIKRANFQKSMPKKWAVMMLVRLEITKGRLAVSAIKPLPIM